MLTTIETLPIIQAPLLKEIPWLLHGFGTKDISLEKYLDLFRVSKVWTPKTKQVHESTVHFLQYSSSENNEAKVLEGDAFVTNQAGVVCFVRTADCLPILLVDVSNRVVGAVHAGWKGTADKILLKTIELFEKKWGSEVKNLKIALGPAIGGHCYWIREDVKETFEEKGLYPGPWMEQVTPKQWFLDIACANLHLLERKGVPRGNIYLSLACTACDLKRFHSFRKEGGKKGEQVNFIMIRGAGEQR